MSTWYFCITVIHKWGYNSSVLINNTGPRTRTDITMSSKKHSEKNLEKILNIRVSAELAEALEETKWSLRKSVSEVVREAVELYLDNNLQGDIKLRVNQILHKEVK